MSKVLLVEDDINLREIYAARLNAEGYELVLAADGEEALSKAVSEKPSLILLDIMMPKISGFDVLDILRSTPETENTKVVMLSALSQESDKEHGEQLGVDKYLIKSQITLEDVVETVKELVTDTDGGSAQGSPIVTTSGRLPDDNNTNDDTNVAGGEDAQTKQPPKQTAEKAAPKQPQQTKPNQAADEINDIDTQMQQNDGNSQQNASTDQQSTDDEGDQNTSQTQQNSANTQQNQTQDQQNTTQ